MNFIFTDVDPDFVYWQNETYVYDVDGHRKVDIICRPPKGNPLTRIVWSNGTEDNLQYDKNPDQTWITNDLENGLFVMRIENAAKYLGDQVGCASYNHILGFVGKYQLQLTKIVLVGAPEMAGIQYAFDKHDELKVSWNLKRPRYDAQYRIELQQEGKTVYTATTKKTAHTIKYENFAAKSFNVKIVASDPAAQQTFASMKIADSGMNSCVKNSYFYEKGYFRIKICDPNHYKKI